MDENQTVWEGTPPQKSFWKMWFHSPDWALSFVAGFGSGKSEIMHIIGVMINDMHEWANIAIYAPTFDLLNLNNIPRIEELLTQSGKKYKFNKKEMIFTIPGHGQIICRSMDNPGRIIAYEVFASLVDELDTMTTAKATEAWDKLISRNRQQPPVGTIIPKGTLVKYDEKDAPELLSKPIKFHNGMEVINKCGVFTTPEGFKFTYKKWEKETNLGYNMVRASTYSNPHLPKSYIENLKSTYPAHLIEAYLEGKFVNLNGRAVYHAFNRFDHHTDFTFADIEESLLELELKNNVA